MATQKNGFENFKSIEPLKKNRFIIQFTGIDIPDFIFRNFKIYNQGDDIIFETKIWQTSSYTFNPGDFYRIVGVRIDYLDPIGATANGYTFDVKGSNFKIKKSYEDDGISTVKFRFVVDISSIKLLNKNLNE